MFEREHALRAGTTVEERLKQQERMRVMRGIIKRRKKVGRMDAPNNRWITELLAADCERMWLDSEGKEDMRMCKGWLFEETGTNECRRERETHQKMVGKMIVNAAGRCWVFRTESRSLQRKM